MVFVDGATMEQLLSVAPMRCLAAQGGTALLSDRLPLRRVERFLISDPGDKQPSVAVPVPGLSFEDAGTLTEPDGTFRVSGVLDLADRLGADVQHDAAVHRVLVVVASAGPPPASRDAGDELSAVILAEGTPGAVAGALAGAGCARVRSLSSDSTRRNGIVTSRDVATTVLSFLGERSPNGDPEGSTIRVTDAPAPFELHERYLAMRRMSVPIQTAAGLYVTVVGLFGIALLAFRRRVPERLARFGGWTALTVIPLAAALLAAGHLAMLSYATVVPFAIGVTVLGVLAVVPLQRFGTSVPTAVLGASVLLYFVVEAALGWTAALTPFLGGSELDGGRFYGLPNVFIGLLAGCALFVAVRLGPIAGWLLVAGVGLFAGLPFAGSNLGASVTLFAAAGICLAVRRWDRLGWRPVVAAVATVVVGTGVVLLAHRVLTSAPTHVTRFEETAGRSLSGVWGTVSDRFLVGWRLILRNPFALVPVFGVPLTLIGVLRPPPGVRDALERHHGLRDAIVVTLVAGLVAVLSNDSWPAAMGLAFGLGLGGLLYVSLAGRTGMMRG
ncbi:MAG TPA: hypothetical protein VF984_11025 [Actinomycetota bacterium]